MKPSILSMSANKWNTTWSENVPASPTQEGLGWKITIPQGVGPPVQMGGNCPEIDYLTCNHTASITQRSIQMEINIECAQDAYLDYYTEEGNNPSSGAIPPSVRFLIYRDMSSEFGRWWSTQFIPLQFGTNQILTIDLVPSNFSSVFGKMGNLNQTTINAFNFALKNPRQLGMTFGGGYFYSHGLISRNGPTTIHCPSYKLIA